MAAPASSSRMWKSVHALAWAAELGCRRIIPYLPGAFSPSMDREFRLMVRKVCPYTVSSIARMHALYQGVQRIVKTPVPGDVVECGVWRGGSMMLAAETLAACGDRTRKIFLYDTFRGMSEPSEKDVTFYGFSAHEKWAWNKTDRYNRWFYAPLSEVRQNMEKTAYPSGQFVYVQGNLLEPLPQASPSRIALLRIDVDFYSATRRALELFYPRLVRGGVLLMDDYGHWKGARQAADDFFETLGESIPAFQKVDYSGVVAVKE